MTSLSGTQYLFYDFAGNVASSTVNGVTSSNSTTNTTNYTVPSQITVGSLSTSMTYNSFLGLTNETDPSGASTTIGYDAMARPTSTTSPFGATTTTTYNDLASPPNVQTSVNGRWTKTTMDGLGRTIKTETGNASGTVSVAETVYDSCGCSPTGKMVQTAIPHAYGATPVWTTYKYDGIGRTLTTSTVGTDTTSTTNYVYQGNTVTVADAMGIWKKYTMNALGQLIQVNEPDPAGGNNVYFTYYTYDSLGHLTGVSMPRPTGTQTRAFNYGNPPGALLLSATNPENGTVTYDYNADNTLAEKIDAKGQRVRYTYDAYKRVTEVRRGTWGTVTNNTLVINVTGFGTGFQVGNASSYFSDLQVPPNYDGTPENFTFTTHDNFGQYNLRVYYTSDYPYVPYGTANSLTLNGQQYYPVNYPAETCDGYGDCYVEFGTAPAGGPITGFQEDTCQRETYTYDSGTYGLGRLTGLGYQGGLGFYSSGPSCDHTFSENFAFSQAGGMTSQSFGASEPARNYSGGGNVGATLTASYTYDNEGRITATQYPSSWNGSAWVSGPNIGNTFDTMGRLQKVTDLGASSDIISNATYGPAGQLLTMTAGASQGISETRSYNSIGQLTLISSCVNSYGTCTPTLNAQYNYSATQNNGKITSQTDGLSGEQVVYTYDSLNRLASASGNGWGQSYNYDGFGNLTDQNVTSGTVPTLHVTYDPSTNRQTGGECADANGNLNASSFACGGGYVYDMENRIVSQATSWLGTPTVAYAYKPGNKRIWKGTGYVFDGQNTLPANEELTFWSISGQKLCSYNLSQYQPGGSNTLPQLVAAQTATNYYFGGRLIKNTTGFVTPDRLGSIGKYFPYGQERPSATTNGKEKFATYFRDSETGLDYANQRYHQVGMGRFMTADPSMASGGTNDPGSWNRYAYSGGDPVNNSDPGGLQDASISGNCNPALAPFNPAFYQAMCVSPLIGGNIQNTMGATMSGGIACGTCNSFPSGNLTASPSVITVNPDALGGEAASCVDPCTSSVQSTITFDTNTPNDPNASQAFCLGPGGCGPSSPTISNNWALTLTYTYNPVGKGVEGSATVVPGTSTVYVGGGLVTGVPGPSGPSATFFVTPNGGPINPVVSGTSLSITGILPVGIGATVIVSQGGGIAVGLTVGYPTFSWTFGNNWCLTCQ